MVIERAVNNSSRKAKELAIQVASREFPLSGALHATATKDKRGRTAPRQRVRGNVVSEQLCDDALKLLAPSLDQYKGCKIIDICPGAGLWSRKVHEYLRPRSHILVEPLKHRYRDFLSPLVDEPGSKYEYTRAMVPYEDNPLAELSNDSYIPMFWEDIEPDKPNTTAEEGFVNRSTLVLGNFSRDIKVGQSNSIPLNLSPSEPLIWSFLRNLQGMVGVHAFGPVRLLAWVTDRDKFNFLPRTISFRKAIATLLEEHYIIQEVVGSSSATQARRPSKLDVLSALNIARKMHSTGIQLPECRRSLLHDAAFKSVQQLQTSVENKAGHSELSATTGESLANELPELIRLERQYGEGKFTRYKPPEKGADKRIKVDTPEFKRRNELRDKFDALVQSSDSPGMRSDDVDRCVYGVADLNQLERDLVAKRGPEMRNEPLELDETEKQQMEAHENLVERQRALHNTRDKSNKFLNTIDNLEAVTSEPPLMLWDRREHEPLESESEEFYPLTKLALLDFQPRTRESENPETTHSQIFVRALRHHSARPVTEALEVVAHGCSADILAKCPSIRNPLLGGRLHLENLRIRMLTQQMWKELSVAWSQWPFRLSDERLLFQMGRSTKFNDLDNHEV